MSDLTGNGFVAAAATATAPAFYAFYAFIGPNGIIPVAATIPRFRAF